jgi:hypothetical protein
VCILELALAPMIADPDFFWSLAPENLAGNRFHTFKPEFFNNERRKSSGALSFDWEKIFSVGPSDADHTANSKRSAEFIVRRELDPTEPNSAPIPFELVIRVLAPDESVRQLTQDQSAFLASTGKPIERISTNQKVPIFFTPTELLKSERGFARSIIWRKQRDAAVIDRLDAALAAIFKFELDCPELCPVMEHFPDEKAAYGHHGVAHTARVMFWAAFLVQNLPVPDREQILRPVLVAAALHDTCRVSDAENPEHGCTAVNKFQRQIESTIGNPPQVVSCLQAIRLHCQPDEICGQKENLVWQILKDADALDRGRFERPNYPNGCDARFFRTETLRLDAPHFNIAWMAFHLAHMTSYLPLDDKPCASLGRAIHNGVEAVLHRCQE